MPEVKEAPPGMFCPFMSGAPLAVQTSPLARADGAMAPKRDASKLTPCIESKCRAWHHARKDCKITLAADAQLVAPQLIHQGFSELLGMIASLAEAMGYQRIVPPAEDAEGGGAARAEAESREPTIIVAGPEDVPPAKGARRG